MLKLKHFNHLEILFMIFFECVFICSASLVSWVSGHLLWDLVSLSLQLTLELKFYASESELVSRAGLQHSGSDSRLQLSGLACQSMWWHDKMLHARRTSEWKDTFFSLLFYVFTFNRPTFFGHWIFPVQIPTSWSYWKSSERPKNNYSLHTLTCKTHQIPFPHCLTRRFNTICRILTEHLHRY